MGEELDTVWAERPSSQSDMELWHYQWQGVLTAGKDNAVHQWQLQTQSFGSDQGIPLVLIHSLGASHVVWDDIIPFLDPSLRVITVDLPGHGDSPCVPLPAGKRHRSFARRGGGGLLPLRGGFTGRPSRLRPGGHVWISDAILDGHELTAP